MEQATPFAIDQAEEDRLNALIFSGEYAEASEAPDRWTRELDLRISRALSDNGYSHIADGQDGAISLWQRPDGGQAVAWYGCAGSVNDGIIAIGVDSQIELFDTEDEDIEEVTE